MAAGLGTRMKSDTAKVLHKIAGRPMLHWVVTAARAAGAERIVAILGHQHEQVKTSLDASFGAGKVEIALQPEQRGTGHATLAARLGPRLAWVREESQQILNEALAAWSQKSQTPPLLQGNSTRLQAAKKERTFNILLSDENTGLKQTGRSG